MELQKTVLELSQRAKKASTSLVTLSSDRKNEFLNILAARLAAEKINIQAENQKDLVAGQEKGLSAAMLDRLRLSDTVIDSMKDALIELTGLPDPVGNIDQWHKRPNGLRVGRMRVPLGVIAMIYESRPNVTVEAAALCLKAGNAIILRGGSEAIHSNIFLTKLLKSALAEAGVGEDVVQIIPVVDRQAVHCLLKLEEQIDLVIPRGGESLIRFVTQNSSIPVLKHYKGVCHIFVDKDADLDKTIPIILNSKTQRPGVCNALEGVLVHRDISAIAVPRIAEHLSDAGVTIKGCELSRQHSDKIEAAIDTDWGTEFLDLTLCMRVVQDFNEAKAYIEKHGSRHTEAIITENYTTAQRFIDEIDASAVIVNAATRFNDGGQLGLGAEIGISTTKLHAYGPMGLEELTTRKFIVYGEGQVRK